MINLLRLLGAYYAVKVNYASALTDDLLEQAVTKEDELVSLIIVERP